MTTRRESSPHGEFTEQIHARRQRSTIGEHLGDLDGQTFGRLPRGWSILYLLSLLGAMTVKRLVEERFIHPKLTLREAKALVARLTQTEARVRKANVRQWLRRSAEFVRNNKSDWKPDELDLVT